MFDAIFFAYVVINVYLGFRFGIFRRVVHLGAFFLGMLLAQALSVGFTQLLNYNTGRYPVSAHFVVYLGILLLLVVVAEVLGFAYASALRFLSGLVLDRLMGTVVGLATAVLELSILLYLFGQMIATQGPTGTAQLSIVTSTAEQLSTSPTVKQLKRIEPYSLVFYRPVLPPEPATYFTKSFS